MSEKYKSALIHFVQPRFIDFFGLKFYKLFILTVLICTKVECILKELIYIKIKELTNHQLTPLFNDLAFIYFIIAAPA